MDRGTVYRAYQTRFDNERKYGGHSRPRFSCPKDNSTKLGVAGYWEY